MFVFVPLIAGLSGCPIASVESAIETWVPVGLNALGIIVSLIPGLSLAAPIVMLVKAGFADVMTAINQYNAAPAADKMTLKEKIATALTILEGDLNEFWTNLNIPDAGLSGIIAGLLGLLLSALGGFMGQLGVLPTTTALQERDRKVKAAQAKGLHYAPRKWSLSEFKKEFNSKLPVTYTGPKL
jgi:hypothetical protein